MMVEEAVIVLLEGSATLETHQDDPPIALVPTLSERISDEAVFGPPLDTPDLLQKAASQLVVNGIHQTIVEGLPVRWVTGGKALFREARVRQCQNGVEGGDLYSQLKATLSTHLRTRAETVMILGKVSTKEARNQCLIRGNRGNLLDGTWEFRRLSPAWYDFRTALRDLEKKIKKAISRGLTTGRILCCEEAVNGERLLHPEQIGNARSSKSPVRFCFTSDLPAIWFEQNVTGDMTDVVLATKGKPGRRKGTGYQMHDGPFVELALKHLKSGKARSGAHAVRMVTDHARGAIEGASPEAIQKRLERALSKALKNLP